MGADEPAGLRVAEANGPGNSHRYLGRGTVLLAAEKLLWSEARRADVRHGDDNAARPESPAHRGETVSGASAPCERVHRAAGLGCVHRSIRPPTYAVLLGPAVLRDVRVWRGVSIRRVQADGATPAVDQRGAIVSLNDHPDIRRVFDGFHLETVPIQYTVGGGRGLERNELITFSWDDAVQLAELF